MDQQVGAQTPTQEQDPVDEQDSPFGQLLPGPAGRPVELGVPERRQVVLAAGQHLPLERVRVQPLVTEGPGVLAAPLVALACGALEVRGAHPQGHPTRGGQARDERVGQGCPTDAVDQDPAGPSGNEEGDELVGQGGRRTGGELGAQRRPASSGGRGTAGSVADRTISRARSWTLRPRERAVLRNRSKACRGELR